MHIEANKKNKSINSSCNHLSEDPTIDFHVEMVKKIDTLLHEHGLEIEPQQESLHSTDSHQQDDHAVELRTPIARKTKVQEPDFLTKHTFSDSQKPMPKEFKSEFPITNNPDFRFVTSLDPKEDVLKCSDEREKHIEIIDLHSFLAEEEEPPETVTLLRRVQEKMYHWQPPLPVTKTTMPLHGNIEIIDIAELISTPHVNRETLGSYPDLTQQADIHFFTKPSSVSTMHLRRDEPSFHIQEIVPIHHMDHQLAMAGFGIKVRTKEERQAWKQQDTQSSTSPTSKGKIYYLESLEHDDASEK